MRNQSLRIYRRSDRLYYIATSVLMRLVDTSARIEWLIASPAGKSVEVALPTPADWLVPTIVQLELAKWLAREVGEDNADQVVAFTQMCFVVRLDTKIALAAAKICGKHRSNFNDAHAAESPA
jgi:predicted nucleic acid-binding protein